MKDCWLSDGCKKFITTQGHCMHDFCLKQDRIDSLYLNSELSLVQKQPVKLVVEPGPEKELFLKLREYEDNIVEFINSGKNLYFYSHTPGNGKTMWSIRLIQSYLNKVWYGSSSEDCKALFVSVPRFLLALKDNITEKNDYVDRIKRNVLKADLVVWDEIGIKSFTQFEHENLLNLINTRLDLGKSNIYTSNLNGVDLQEQIGERLYSRIVNMSINFEFIGCDKRFLNVGSR